MKTVRLLFAFTLIVIGSASTLTKTLSHGEQQKLVKILDKNHDNLESIYYAATSLNALGKSLSSSDEHCKIAINKVDQEDSESVFQFSEVVKTLKCKDVPPLSLSALISEQTDSLQFSQIVGAMVNLEQKVDATTLKKYVSVVKDNDTPGSAAVAFYTASLLPKSDELAPVIAMVEDILAQADEIDGDVLQFEGGLAVTSSVVRGVVLLGEKNGAALLKPAQAVKFAQYFVNRKFVYHLRDIHSLVVVLNALSSNKLQVPVVVSVHQSNSITRESKVLKVRATNLLDQAIPNAKIIAKSFSTVDDSVTLFDNKPFTKSPEKEDYLVFEGDVARGYIAAHSFGIDIMASNPTKGMYKCSIEVQAPKEAKNLVIAGTFEIDVKVLARVMVEDVEIAVGDKDHALSKTTPLAYPNKLSSPIEADYHQKIVMTFNLKDLHTKELVTAHQTFIRLVHQKTGQEIFFVAEADESDNYKFTLDVGAQSKDSFNNLSGDYKMSLIVGDATMQVPINWALGDVLLTFAGQPKKSKRQERMTDPKPVIEHMFRIPEKRPAKVVSTAFTVLVLSPLLVMFGMWIKIGANISNFSLSLPTLLFHVGLAGIFVLYYLFWVKLNMFETLKLLAVVGGLTFLGGNKMLADMAATKYRS